MEARNTQKSMTNLFRWAAHVLYSVYESAVCIHDRKYIRKKRKEVYVEKERVNIMEMRHFFITHFILYFFCSWKIVLLCILMIAPHGFLAHFCCVCPHSGHVVDHFEIH